MNQFWTRTDPIGGPTYSPTIVILVSRFLRFVAARAKAVSERALVPEDEILAGALSSIP